jgi:hypothetical protein
MCSACVMCISQAGSEPHRRAVVTAKTATPPRQPADHDGRDRPAVTDAADAGSPKGQREIPARLLEGTAQDW